MRVVLLIFSVLILSLSGCASLKKDSPGNQLQHLQMQISNLQSELRQKDEEIGSLSRQLEQEQEEKIKVSKDKKTKISATGNVLSVKKIQLALKNAGLYNGVVDGKIGRDTKKAIRDFQKANGLAVDGIAGGDTCMKLEKYLK